MANSLIALRSEFSPKKIMRFKQVSLMVRTKRSACHLLRELAATTPTQAVRMGRLVDMAAGLLWHRKELSPLARGDTGGSAFDADPSDGLLPVPRPSEPLALHLIDMIRSLYGVDLVVKPDRARIECAKETDVHVNGET